MLGTAVLNEVLATTYVVSMPEGTQELAKAFSVVMNFDANNCSVPMDELKAARELLKSSAFLAREFCNNTYRRYAIWIGFLCDLAGGSACELSSYVHRPSCCCHCGYV